MNKTVLAALLSLSDAATLAPRLLRLYLNAFNSRDPVLLRFFVADGNGEPLETVRASLVALIRTEFFFLKERPAIADVVAGPIEGCDALIRTPALTSAVTPGAIPVLDPAAPETWLDFVFGRVDHAAYETGFGGNRPAEAMSQAQQTTHDHWNKRPSKRSPVDYPPYREAYNRRVTGSPGKTLYAWFADRLTVEPASGRWLSLGCGAGANEFSLLEHAPAPAQFDAFDFSEERIAMAAAEARRRGLGCMNYFVQDAHYLYLPENRYDMVMAFGSLHHFYNLERIYWEVARSLKPGGLFLIWDYCGPSRMQFGRMQEELIDRLVKTLPPQLRVLNDRPELQKNGFSTPPLDLMKNLDYSEGIRAAEIVPLLTSRFTVTEEKGAGGTLLPHVFNDIENSIDPANAQHMELVKGLVELEEELLQRKVVTHDYRCLVCRPKKFQGAG